MEIFITKIKVNESRQVRDLEIPLCGKERQHLFITGKNGSGKTSLRIEINKFLCQTVNGNYQHYSSMKQALASCIRQQNHIDGNTEIKPKLKQTGHLRGTREKKTVQKKQIVLSSVSNATVCDLENKTVITDLSAYSYDALLEGK